MGQHLYPTRRKALAQAACGFGSLAFAGLSCAGKHTSSFTPSTAKRIIFLFMQGGVSQVDSFDYKPRLFKDNGKMLSFEDARIIANTGQKASSHRVMKPLWKFSRYGECGKWASGLFPEMNMHVDKMTFVHSMHTEGVAHGPATLFLHCGSTNFVRPSIGSWILYGLGSANQNLPGFISIAPSSGNGGPRNYSNAFLPTVVQGTAIGRAGGSISDLEIRNLSNPKFNAKAQREQLDLLKALQAEQLNKIPGDSEAEAVIESFELGWKMQQNAPSILDLSKETSETQKLYGIGEKETDSFGRQCLMARRLSESGVRFVQVTYGDNTANPAWDQHSNLQKHADHAKAVDVPIAGLLTDLAKRDMLKETIVWWCGEFGRTPYAEKNGTGRDHNPGGFTTWLAGGGFKPGFSFGSTDEFGAAAVTDKVHMHDLHATILHQLGLDHEKLTYRYNGRDFRLTDVHGRVVKELIS